MSAATFLTVADAGYFPGLAALVNSLRLSGNDGEIVVVDLGLASAQREALAAHCRLVPAGGGLPEHPMLAKCAAPGHLGLGGTIVFVDADVIVTGSLDPVIELASTGKVVAVPDLDERWYAEWQELLGLPCPPRRQRYVNTGLLAYSVDRWPELAGWWAEAGARIPPERTRSGGATHDDPLWDSDQDALNAVLMTRVPEDALGLLRPEEVPSTPWDRRRAEVADDGRVTLDGVPALCVHYAGLAPKPWFPTARDTVERDAYTRLLPRMLLADDLPVRVGPAGLPGWVTDAGELRRLGRRNAYRRVRDRARVEIGMRVRNRLPGSSTRTGRTSP